VGVFLFVSLVLADLISLSLISMDGIEYEEIPYLPLSSSLGGLGSGIFV